MSSSGNQSHLHWLIFSFMTRTSTCSKSSLYRWHNEGILQNFASKYLYGLTFGNKVLELLTPLGMKNAMDWHVDFYKIKERSQDYWFQLKEKIERDVIFHFPSPLKCLEPVSYINCLYRVLALTFYNFTILQYLEAFQIRPLSCEIWMKEGYIKGVKWVL